MLSGRIRSRTGQVVIEAAGRPENPVEGGLAITTIHTAKNDAFPVLWVEPAYGLVERRRSGSFSKARRADSR